MLEIEIEWLDAPGVTCHVLAATWARLKFVAQDVYGEKHAITRFFDAPARSVRDGIYGSAFPLAEWMVENWWFLLHEPARLPELLSGRQLAHYSPALHDWARRHNLLTARHGGALPDLSIYRDHDHVVLRWFRDPQQLAGFIGEGECRLCPHAAEQGLESFVLRVSSRLNDLHDVEVRKLRDEWNALCDSRMENDEAKLCAWAAAMGADAYDPRSLSDADAEMLQHRLAPLPADTRTDLVEAATIEALNHDLDWIARAGKVATSGVSGNGTSWTNELHHSPMPRTAHEWGYRSAEVLRQRMSWQAGPLPEFAKRLAADCHLPWEKNEIVEHPTATNVSGMVIADQAGVPHAVWPARVSTESTRFLTARALFFVPFLQPSAKARLVTKAYTWDQAASRAFAAELLAPATALRAEVSGGISQMDLQDLAQRFEVSPMVIDHQLKNHRIGWLEE